LQFLFALLNMPGGSKNVPLDKMQFLDNQQRCLPKFQDLQQKEFSTILENFIKVFIALRITAFTTFCSILQNYAEKWTVSPAFNVSKQFFVKACSTCPSHLSQKLDVFL